MVIGNQKTVISICFILVLYDSIVGFWVFWKALTIDQKMLVKYVSFCKAMTGHQWTRWLV